MHGFLESVEGIDFEHKVKMGIRNNRYDAMVPTVVAPNCGCAGGCTKRRRGAPARTRHTSSRFTLPGPMTIVDTIADAYYGDKVKMAMAFAELLNQEARALEAQGVDVIQFDEPAFNVYMDDVKRWGIEALHRAIEGLRCQTAVHICYGYGIKANIDWKNSLGKRMAAIRRNFPGAGEEPPGPDFGGVHPLARADQPAEAAGRQGRDARRDRRGQRQGRDRRRGRWA